MDPVFRRAAVTSHDEPHTHPVPIRLYVAVWAGLVALTGITVGAATLDLKQVSTLVAVGIAVLKSSMVLLYFMHLRWDRPVFRYMALAAILAFGIFFALSFLDYANR
jgi:cytochrome c oxidase subunit IV